MMRPDARGALKALKQFLGGCYLVGGLEREVYCPFHMWDNPSH